MELLDEISQRLQQGMTGEVKRLVQRAIDEGVPAQTIWEEGLRSGMDIIGEKFKRNEAFVPEVLRAAGAMNQAPRCSGRCWLPAGEKPPAKCASAPSGAICTTSARTWSG